MVTDVDRNGITVKDSDGTIRRIESACKVWSAGVSASPLGRDLAEQSGREIDRAGRVKVLPDLSIPGHPNVFVVGDMAAVEGVPGMAQGAIQGAKYVGEDRSRPRLEPAPTRSQREPFQYFDKGSMATVSKYNAVAKVGPLEFGGFIAWLAWLVPAPDLPGRLQDQDRHAAVVDRDVPEPQPRPADHHRAAGLRPHPDRATRGHRGLGAGDREGGAELSSTAGRPARSPGSRPPASSSACPAASNIVSG